MFPSSGLYFAIIISNSVGSRAHEKLNADNLPTEKLVQIFFKTASLKEKRKKKKKLVAEALLSGSGAPPIDCLIQWQE